MFNNQLLLLALTVAVIVSGCDDTKPVSKAASPQNKAKHLPASAVENSTVRTLTPSFKFPAVIEAVQSAAIRPEISAILTAYHFSPGQIVAEGDLLIELNDSEFRASRDSAKAALMAAKASDAQAETNWKRAKKLLPKSYISAIDYDKAQAAVEIARAAVAQADAGLVKAELDLSHAKIHAPFSGRISKSHYAIGDLVMPSSPESLFDLVQLDPIYATASIELSIYNNFTLMRMSLEKEGLEMPEVLVTLELTGGQPYPYEGKFENWSTSSQQSSGMIGGRVRMPNPDGLLLPGHNVIIKGKALQPVTRVMIPQKSVFQDQQGHYVMVLDADDVVQRKNINVGVRDGLDWAVQSGLEEGVRVIVEGAGKLSPGTQVTLAKQP